MSSIPVFKEITFNNLNYFNPNSPKKISAKIIDLLGDENKKKNLLKFNKKINKYYSPENILTKFEKLFI